MDIIGYLYRAEGREWELSLLGCLDDTNGGVGRLVARRPPARLEQIRNQPAALWCARGRENKRKKKEEEVKDGKGMYCKQLGGGGGGRRERETLISFLLLLLPSSSFWCHHQLTDGYKNMALASFMPSVELKTLSTPLPPTLEGNRGRGLVEVDAPHKFPVHKTIHYSALPPRIVWFLSLVAGAPTRPTTISVPSKRKAFYWLWRFIVTDQPRDGHISHRYVYMPISCLN